jgi:hypothetical protein
MAHPQSLIDFVDGVNQAGGTYHRIDFGDGLVMDGEYDLQPYWPAYHFPENLTGRTVLDVGTSSGYFALECARRGAEVTAIDIFEGGFQRAVFAGTSIAMCRRISSTSTSSSDNSTSSSVGRCWLHVWDQVGALKKLHAVCRGLTIVATGVIGPDTRMRYFPAAELVGISAMGGEGEYWTTWLPNGMALERMMRAAGSLKSHTKARSVFDPHGQARVRHAARRRAWIGS